MSIKVYMDLDGTVYDLYNIENWEPKLCAEDADVFKEGNFIGNYTRFIAACSELV